MAETNQNEETTEGAKRLQDFLEAVSKLSEQHPGVVFVIGSETRADPLGENRFFNMLKFGSAGDVLTLAAQVYAHTRERFDAELTGLIARARRQART
jgi:hypothetical protein